MIAGYPKIFAMGAHYIPNIFVGAVECTEKIDGSQFGFGISPSGELQMRSKGKVMSVHAPEKMFGKAVEFVVSIEERLKGLTGEDGLYLYGEFLESPCHNVMKYGRVPYNHIILFGASIGLRWITEHEELLRLGDLLGLETVPLLFEGVVESVDQIRGVMERDSILGGGQIEGVVVKNFAQPVMIGNLVIPSFAKFVRAEFKERLEKEWGPKFSSADKLQQFIESFKTEARWVKAVQHLREAGSLVNEPKDIGALIKELERDIVEEEELNIKEWLYHHYLSQIVRVAKHGLPEWYKEQLLKRMFPVEEVRDELE